MAALAPKSICAVKGTALPLTFIITPGQRNEATVLEQLMEQGAVKRKRRGRPRLRPKRVVGDKAYTGRRIRGYLLPTWYLLDHTTTIRRTTSRSI